MTRKDDRMITESMVYWFTRLDGINNLLVGGIIVFGIGGFISAMLSMAAAEAGDEEWMRRLLFKWAPRCFFICVLCSVLIVFVPTTKEMAAIYILPKIANQDMVEEIGTETREIYGLAKDYLQDLLKKGEETAAEVKEKAEQVKEVLE